MTWGYIGIRGESGNKHVSTKEKNQNHEVITNISTGIGKL